MPSQLQNSIFKLIILDLNETFLNRLNEINVNIFLDFLLYSVINF